MRRRLFSLLVVLLAVAGAGLVSRLPRALSRVEAFRITRIRLEGNRFLTTEEAAKAVAISPLASLWEDFDPLEARLRAHPLVEECRAGRRFPGTLVLHVVERQPVALVPNPALEPVDAEGRFLPIDPAVHRLDLPIIGIRGAPWSQVLSAAERRLVAEEIARMARWNPGLVARISEVILGPRGDLWARLWRQNPDGEVWDMPVTLRFRPSLTNRRVQDGLRVLSDALVRFEGEVVADLDLRYEDQVVVRLERAQGN